MSRKPEPTVLCALLLVALTVLRCFALGSTPIERVLLPLFMLGIGALALFLLHWEGVDEQSLRRMLLPIGAALFLRAFLLPHATLDYENFLAQWVDYFREHGGFPALADDLYSCNYNVPYLYMLCLLTYLPISDLYGIKLFSILFDVLLAWGGMRLARRIAEPESVSPRMTFSFLLLLPTVVLNGSCWGQCDSVWAALCLLSLSFALEERPWLSLGLLGLAFAFKLQAIFIIPLWLALWIGGKVRFRHFLAFPGAFLLSILPALLLGKPLCDILGVYVGQASDSVHWETVNYNSPSIFSLVPLNIEFGPETPKVFIALAFLFMAAVLALLIWKRKTASEAAYVLAGAVLSLGIPFFLPYMHERYFFLGGVLLVAWGCARPLYAPTAVAAELASLGGYHAYLTTHYAMILSLFGQTWTQLGEGLLMVTALIGSIYALTRELTAPSLRSPV